MTEDDTPASDLQRTFAPMLAELEDAELRLVQRQNQVARELEGISAELERLAAVKAAMLGQPKPKTRRERTGHTREPIPSQTARAVLAWAKSNGGGEFTADQVARAIDSVTPQGLGPVLAGMVRRGEIEIVREERAAGRSSSFNVYRPA